MVNKIFEEIISIIFKVLFLALAIYLVIIASKWAYNEGYVMLAKKNSGVVKTVSVNIPKGSNTATIADILKDAGLINSTLYFRVMSKLNKVDNAYQYGDFSFSTSSSQDEIMKILTTEGARKEVKKFTIVEGLTLEEVADSLAKQNICSRSDFYSALELKWGYKFLDTVPEDRKVALQGYLLPETYEVYADATAEEIVGVMFNQMNEIWSDETNLIKAKKLGYTVDEIITIASIIEREVVSKAEQPLVSSVIYNRLDNNMPLQMCSTIMYALEVPRDRLFYADLEIDSPYNTYKNIGLPVGPICNPGKDAILAALNPADTDYLYFVLKDDGSQTHEFNKTLEEHNADKEKYIGTFNY